MRHDRTAELLYANTEEADRRVGDAVNRVAHARGVAPAQISLAWLLSRPAVASPIVGAGKLAHLEDAIGSLDIQLDAQEIAALEESYVPHAVSFYQEVPGRDQDR